MTAVAQAGARRPKTGRRRYRGRSATLRDLAFPSDADIVQAVFAAKPGSWRSSVRRVRASHRAGRYGRGSEKAAFRFFGEPRWSKRERALESPWRTWFRPALTARGPTISPSALQRRLIPCSISLVYHELPALEKALRLADPDRPSLTYAPLKGFSHYPCLRKIGHYGRRRKERMTKLVRQQRADPGTLPLPPCCSFIEQTEYDDMDSLKIDYRVLPRRRYHYDRRTIVYDVSVLISVLHALCTVRAGAPRRPISWSPTTACCSAIS